MGERGGEKKDEKYKHRKISSIFSPLHPSVRVSLGRSELIISGTIKW